MGLNFFTLLNNIYYYIMKIILICATGRSGSTTLQRIINTIKRSNINGENWGGNK